MSSTALIQKSLVINSKNIEKAASIYRAINHSLRLQIIEMIHNAGVIHVTPIIQKLKLEQAVISAHLKVLRDANIVNAERKGNNVFYTMNYAQVNRIVIFAERLAPYKRRESTFRDNINRKEMVKSAEGTISFTTREVQVIQLVCQQNSSEEIAEKLGVSKRTAEDYRGNIIKKMKVRNSVGILFFAIKNGLFKI